MPAAVLPPFGTSGTRQSDARFIRSGNTCPISGRKLSFGTQEGHPRQVPDPVLVSHVVATTSLSPGEAARVIDDVISFHAQPVEVYVRERHAQLQTYGARNPEIFARIAEELRERVVAAPELSERQLRRIVYS